MPNDQIIIRSMSETDLQSVLKIQSQSYRADFLESESALAEKRALFPAGCWIGYRGAEPAAYLFSHPWSQASIVELDAPLHALPANPDCYYIHDVSVSARFRKQGIGLAMVRKAKEFAQEQHVTTIMLVAVQGSQKFWAKFGFEPLENPAETIVAKLQSYGENACVMMLS